MRVPVGNYGLRFYRDAISNSNFTVTGNNIWHDGLRFIWSILTCESAINGKPNSSKTHNVYRDTPVNLLRCKITFPTNLLWGIWNIFPEKTKLQMIVNDMSSTMSPFQKTYCCLNYSQVFTKELIKSYSKRSDKKKVQPSIVHSLNAID